MTPLVVANWKAHGNRDFVARLAAAWPALTDAVEVVLCPPWGYLSLVATTFAKHSLRYGVQTTAVAPQGAFTGENTAEMARDLGADFAIVGHSERRRLFGETSDVVAAKFAAALRAGLTPILCVGETQDQRQRGVAEATVCSQLRTVADAVADAGADAGADTIWKSAVIAYEPLWAIGTGDTASPAQAQAMHRTIRAWLPPDARATRLLYGGSVNADNAHALFAEPDIDGALIGGASLDAKAFTAICLTAARSSKRENHPPT